MIRQATCNDIKSMSKIGAEIVTTTMPFFRADELRIEQLLKTYISSASARVFVSIDATGQIAGGALVVSQPNLWAEKHNSQIIGLFTRVVGDGIKMLNAILEWFAQRKNSLIICYAAPIKSRLDALLLKNNFELQGTMLVRRKYHGVP
jgi:putative N-acetylmannosamine-6-phosphate epimerase